MFPGRTISIAALTLSLAAATHAATNQHDPAARGIDLFLHAPDRAAPGAAVPIQIEALGFPTVLALEPLASIPVEATWDPEHLGPGLSAVPPPIRATTDAAGRAHLDVPVPDGDERDLVLLVGARSGDHQRTREITIHRVRPHVVSLHVADDRVVPGSTISAWVLVSSAVNGEPSASTPVDLELLEGGVARHHVRLTTDGSGTAMARVPIPTIDDPAFSWSLSARVPGAEGHDSSATHLRLLPREETPGAPSLTAHWDSDAVIAGDRAKYSIRVEDATGVPVASLPVRVWIGPRGIDPPRDDAGFRQASTELKTDAAGRVEGSFAAPTTIGKAGTALQIIARASLEGHDLDQSSWITVGLPQASIEILPEAGSIVPGVDQRLLVRARDGRGAPIAAAFSLEGDGLRERITTDASGEAEVRWKVPAEIGAHHKIGPCASSVAAVVVFRPEGTIPALGPRRDPFEPCVPVNREVKAIVKPDLPFAQAGGKVHVRVERAPGSPAAPGKSAATTPIARDPWSIVIRSSDGAEASSAWIADGAEGGDIPIPAGARGLWSVSVAAPEKDREAVVAGGNILVLPRVLPLIAGKVAGGRAVPGGAVDLDVDLTDGHGTGLPGTVAAVVFDAFGGGTAAGLSRLDTRGWLCGLLSVEDARCKALLEGDRSADPWRRGLLGEQKIAPLAPAIDPAGTASKAMSDAFRDVVSSLEGAVFESTASADLLRDARRKASSGWTFNPELFTLVTSSMEPRPLTPGGELLALGDLVAIDPQVTFDNVARRVTRLKLFRILSAVRDFRHEHNLDPDEPALRDPNALLRRLVGEGKLDESALLDPWGGTIQFTRAAGAGLPFVSVVKGFELHAPGPDGALGTGDDVRDPLGRVLKSNTPYAVAVGEDKIVDSKALLEVGDATVSAWSGLLETLTGTSLGHGGGTGTGQGFGSGHGRLGGSHRVGVPSLRMGSVVTGDAFFSPPVRTDDRGHTRLHVPLGDAETTWRVILVGIPDHALPTTTTVDVPVATALSAKIDPGARWVAGDEVDVAVTVRNRTAKPLRASLDLEAGGTAAILDGAPARSIPRASRGVDVAAGGTARTSIRVKAAIAGTARLKVTTQAPGLTADTLEETWEVRPPGEPTSAARTAWVEGSADVSAWLASSDPPLGPPRLTLERGPHAAIAAAIASLDPDRLTTPMAMADAVDVASRVEQWAAAEGADGEPLRARAAEIARRAVGRIAVYAGDRDRPAGSTWSAVARAFRHGPADQIKVLPEPKACPPNGAPTVADVSDLDAEPPPASGTVAACWDAFVTGAVQAATVSHDPVAMARAVLALADRPHRAATLASLVDRLRAEVALTPRGEITLPGPRARDRAARAIVFAALLRAARGYSPGPAPAGHLVAWALVQRDGEGGYGSPTATAAVVRALLDVAPDRKAKTTVTLITDGARRAINVGPSGIAALPIDPKTTQLKLETQGPGLVARLDRAVLRPWTRAPEDGESPVRLEVTWPGARAGRTAPLIVRLGHDLGRPTAIDVRIPLPPGVSLAAPTIGVHQVQGVLAFRRSMDASALPTTIELPLRFSLSGVVTIPEAAARLASEAAPRALAAPRPLRIE